MADFRPATMEEIALKLWAMRTGQRTWEDDAPPDTYPIVPLTVSQGQIEGQAAN